MNKLSSAFATKSSASKISGDTHSRDNHFTPISENKKRLRRSTPSITPDRRIAPRLAEERCKIFNDPVHKSIELDELCLRIIDTPQYKRLHGLKQLGVCDNVFRSATHTRFEHSLGVAHLAGKAAAKIHETQPYLGISKADIKCLKIAGLCHDLGHGPFSHVYDGVFMKRMLPKGEKWRHEDGSVQMLGELLEKNGIKFEDYGLTARDKLFIEEIIGGVEGSHRRGRDLDKMFLYDIVNNTRSGLDVDKIDYFLRDAMNTNANYVTIDVDRLFANCSVRPVDVKGGTELMMCYPEKMVGECLSFFRVRFDMHTHVYTHKTVKAVEYMVTDALVLANPYIFINGTKTAKHPDGRYKMSECIYDMTALSNLKDSIVDIIKYDANPLLLPAQELLKRLDQRNLYKVLGKTRYQRSSRVYYMQECDIEREILAIQDKYLCEGRNDNNHYDNINSNNDDLKLESINENNKINNCSSSNGFDEDNEEVEHDDDFLDSPSGNSAFRLSHRGPGTFSRMEDSPDSKGGRHAMSYCSQETTLSALSPHDARLVMGDMIVEKMHIHFGSKDKNPVDRMRFYEKDCSKYDENSKGVKIDEIKYEASMPRHFEEMNVRLFCKDPEKVNTARKLFNQWCEGMNLSEPFPSLSQQSPVTPSTLRYSSSQLTPMYSSRR